jgi:hypothetical protein
MELGGRISSAPDRRARRVHGDYAKGRSAPEGYRSGGGRLVQFGGASKDVTLSLALRSCSNAGEGTWR